jgi:hypothetical protein
LKTLVELMDAAEKANDVHTRAVITAANARADYELALHKHLLSSKEKSVAARRESAEIAAGDEHRVFLRSDALERAAKTNVQVMLGLLVAAQSRDKYAAKQDGGEW